MSFSANVGTIFWSQTTLGPIFSWIFMDFDQIFRDVIRISTNQNFWGCACTPASYTTAIGKSTLGPCLEKILPAPMFRGTCPSIEMLKGYMAWESLGTPGLSGPSSIWNLPKSRLAIDLLYKQTYCAVTLKLNEQFQTSPYIALRLLLCLMVTNCTWEYSCSKLSLTSRGQYEQWTVAAAELLSTDSEIMRDIAFESI